MDTPNCVKLEMAPKVIEERLKTGLRLILVAAIWSGPDLREIDRAVRFAARRTDVMVGIRRFNDSAETAAWLPEVPVTPASPIWVVLKDGVVVRTWVGLSTDEQLDEALA